MSDEINAIIAKTNYLVDSISSLKEIETIRKQLEQALEKKTELQVRMKDFEKILAERDELAQSKKTMDETAVQMISEVLSELKNPEPDKRVYSKELLDSGLPAKIESHIDNEIKIRLAEAQSELVKIYYIEANKALNYFENTLWPSELRPKTPDKVARLKKALSDHPFATLKGIWKIPCDYCDDPHNLNLSTEYEIAQLLRTGSATPETKVNSKLGYMPHASPVTLETLVRMYLVKFAKQS